MSYLDVPRIHFAGRFFTDPSTINNDRTHYDPAITDPSPWWNPNGNHNTEFRHCRVTTAYDLKGNVLQLPSDDPVIGAAISTPFDPTTSAMAKIVDLDVDQQGVSTFYGLNLRLKPADGVEINGSVEPPSLNSLWRNVMPSMDWQGGEGGGDPPNDVYFSGSFQTIVTVPEAQWPATPSSPLLTALRQACGAANGNLILSFKFVLDAYFDDNLEAGFKTGRIVGTLGAGQAAEPVQCPAARWLNARPFPTQTPNWNYLAFNGAPFQIDAARNKLVVDLGNSIPVMDVASSSAHLGQLTAAIDPADGPRIVIGSLDYSQYCHMATAGITEVDITPAQQSLLTNNPLKLVASDAGPGPAELFSEDAAGLYFAVDQRVFRMALDTTGYQTMTTNVYATRFGVPTDVPLQFVLLASIPNSSGGFDLPQPTDGLTFTIAPSGTPGKMVVTLNANKDPGQPPDRPAQLDGQVYQIGLTTAPPPQPNISNFPQERTISVHLYANYAVQTEPGFEVIRDLMAPYMKLYPAMRESVELRDKATFRFYSNMPPPAPLAKGIMFQLLTAPFNSPQFMPITRDLSPNKTQTILNYMQNVMNRLPGATAPTAS